MLVSHKQTNKTTVCVNLCVGDRDTGRERGIERRRRRRTRTSNWNGRKARHVYNLTEKTASYL